LLAQVPAAEWSRNEAALLMLADSLLGSAMAPAINISNEEAVAETIKKRLVRGGIDGTDKAVKFSEVLVELQKNVQLKSPLINTSLVVSK
jgi:hypothetical protein